MDELLVGLENGCRLARGYRDARGAGEDILTDGAGAQVCVCVCSDPGRILNADSGFRYTRRFALRNRMAQGGWKATVNIMEEAFFLS